LNRFQVSFGYNFGWIKWFSKFILFIHMHMQNYDRMLVLHIPHQKKTFVKYRLRTHSRWQIALIPMVSSSGMTYTIMVSIPSEKHMYIWHTSPLITQVVSTHLTLRGQRYIRYKNIFTFWGRDHKTFLGPHTLGAWLWPVTRQTCSPYHTIGTILKQASSRGDGFGIHITRWEELTFSSMRCYRKVNYLK
jgi:hypothetical protein